MILNLTLCFGILAIICSLCVITVKNPVHAILYLILVFCNISFILVIWNVEFVAIIFLIVYVGAIAVLFLFVVMMLNIKIIELNEVFWRYIPIGLMISFIFILQIYVVLFDKGLFSLFSNLFSNVDRLFFFNVDYLLNEGFDFNMSKNVFVFDKQLVFFDYNIVDFLFVTKSVVKIPDFYYNDYTYWLYSNEIKSNTEILGWFVYTYGFFLFFVIGLILLLAMIGSIVLILNQNVNVKRQLIYRQVSRNFYNSVKLVR